METPSQEIFDEMKSLAIQIWSTYDNTYGYVTEKLGYVNRIDNVKDNAMVFYRMFDHSNQQTFKAHASPKVLVYIEHNK